MTQEELEYTDFLIRQLSKRQQCMNHGSLEPEDWKPDRECRDAAEMLAKFKHELEHLVETNKQNDKRYYEMQDAFRYIIRIADDYA